MGLINLFRSALRKEGYTSSDYSSNGVGEETAKILREWASQLPTSSLGILDMAAGQGIASEFLARLGNKVTAYDTSSTMRRGAVYPVKHGDMTTIRLPRKSHSGILVKDAWVFLDSKERARALRIFYSTLVNGGSVLLLSQKNDTRAHVVPHDSGYPIKIIESDYNSTADWKAYVDAEIKRGGKLLSIEYQTDSDTMYSEASLAGFTATVDEYRFDSRYAQENIWVKKSQVVATLQK